MRIKGVFWLSRKIVGIKAYSIIMGKRLSDNSCPVSRSFPYRSVQNPDTSFAVSCAKFCEILRQVPSMTSLFHLKRSLLEHYTFKDDFCYERTFFLSFLCKKNGKYMIAEIKFKNMGVSVI